MIPQQQHVWLRLGSGRRLDVLNPDPQTWTDADLAVGLSRTYRWGSTSRWELPLSVAQHSLTCSPSASSRRGVRCRPRTRCASCCTTPTRR